MREEPIRPLLPQSGRQGIAEADTVVLPRVASAPIELATTLKMPRVPHRHPWRMKGTLVALILFLLINIVVQIYRRPLVVLGDGFWALRRVQACESLGQVPDVLYLGSSRTFFGVSPHTVDDTLAADGGKRIVSCNVGALGSNFEEDYYTLKRMVEDGFVPKAVVENLWEYNINLGASLTAKSNQAQNIAEADTQPNNLAQIMNLADLADTTDLNLQFSHVTAPNLSQSEFLLRKLVPVYGARFGLLRLGCAGTKIGPCAASLPGMDDFSQMLYRSVDDRGWDADSLQTIADLTPAQQRDHVAYFHGSQHDVQQFHIGGQQRPYLARLVALAKTHHIQVALVVSPVHPYFFSYFPHATDWAMIMQYWQAFALAQNVPFYNESQPVGYHDWDFLDPIHLSAAGAVKFSAWLARKVVAPLLAVSAA